MARVITVVLEGLNWGGGGGATCQLSVEISLLFQLSITIFDLCRLSVNLS